MPDPNALLRNCPQEGRKRYNSLCWLCRNAYSGCSWSRYSLPVPGWTAVRNDLSYYNGKLHTVSKSYAVLDCPQFRLEARFAEAYKRFSPEMAASELENKRKLQEIARRKQT